MNFHFFDLTIFVNFFGFFTFSCYKKGNYANIHKMISAVFDLELLQVGCLRIVLNYTICNSFKQGDINILDEFAWKFDVLTEQEIAKVKPDIYEGNCLNITISHC